MAQTHKKTIKHVTRPKTRKAAKVSSNRSFRVSSNGDFFSLRPSRQTIYWLIIAVLVVGLGVWVFWQQLQIDSIYDTVQNNNTVYNTAPAPKTQVHHT